MISQVGATWVNQRAKRSIKRAESGESGGTFAAQGACCTEPEPGVRWACRHSAGIMDRAHERSLAT